MLRGYEKPDTLKSLIKIDHKLMREHGKGFDNFFGGHLTFKEESDYSCTPKDSIIFLWDGANGDHFAFHTQGGSVANLDCAPILFIQPMDTEDRVKIVADNLMDFLALFISLKELYVLENFSWYQNEEQFNAHYKEFYLEDIKERDEDISIITGTLLTEINIPEIKNVYEYMVLLKKKHPKY